MFCPSLSLRLSAPLSGAFEYVGMPPSAQGRDLRTATAQTAIQDAATAPRLCAAQARVTVIVLQLQHNTHDASGRVRDKTFLLEVPTNSNYYEWGRCRPGARPSAGRDDAHYRCDQRRCRCDISRAAGLYPFRTRTGTRPTLAMPPCYATTASCGLFDVEQS